MGLRDYGTARWEGGESGCDHVDEGTTAVKARLKSSHSGDITNRVSGPQTAATANIVYYRDRCGKCGAVRVDRQLGLEPTVGEFVANLVAVCRLLRPALRDDGVMFLNLGDSYSNDTKWGGATGGKHAAGLHGEDGPGRGRTASGLPPKCLTLAPARFAIAMCDDGWILRNAIVWHKPNPMPESVTDRFTTSHEHVYFFAKSPRYWADMEAVREPHSDLRDLNRWHDVGRGQQGWAAASGLHDNPQRDSNGGVGFHPAGRNARDVWTIPTAGFPGAHYATFPPELARRCVRAGCPPRVCARCGSPWERVVEREFMSQPDVSPERVAHRTKGLDASNGWGGMPRGTTATTTLGWRAACACGPDAGTRPGTVLDPFMGSGTTALVATQENRDWIGVDLDGRSVGWTAERLAGAQRRLPLDLATEAAGG